MPHRKILREAFEPEQIDVIVRAYERALSFVLSSGDADGDPKVESNIAIEIVAAGRETAEPNFVDLTNRAIARYRVKRAHLLIAATRVTRAKGG